MIKVYDTDKWIEGMTEKISLRYYIQEKRKIGYENCYRNNSNSIFLARARTNTLKLEEIKAEGFQVMTKRVNSAEKAKKT